ncbi:MAG: hypothetical protein IPQ13_06270 [Holophagaceae bacterium]|nr:hypothetical protein [Holophagaceae bacterium]
MSRIRRGFSSFLTALGLAFLSAACGGGGSGTPPPPPTTGSLALTVTGLPGGASAAIALSGPGGFSQNPTASASWPNLTPGSYVITASNVTSASLTYQPSPATQTATVTAGQNAIATVAYAPQPVAISVSPTNPKIGLGGTVQLNAVVTGSADTAVIWEVLESAGGSVTGPGLYTAPNTVGAYHVRATAHADPSKRSDATITVSALGGFRIYPAGIDIYPGAAADFSAYDDNTVVTTVAWSVPAAAGTINPASGHFVAGSTLGTWTLTVTNTVTLQTATATINVVNNVTFALYGFPDQGHLYVGDGAMFGPVLGPEGIDRTIAWSILPGGAGGQLVDMSWYQDYYAPTAPGTATIRAVPAADPTKAAQRTLIVDPAPPGSGWALSTVGSPARTRIAPAMATMPDDRVVIAGGGGGPTWYYNELVEVYAPGAGTFSSLANPLPAGRMFTTLTPLDANRLLVAGGEIRYDQASNTGEVVNLQTGAVTPATGTLRVPRMGHQATSLTTGPNAGKVLLTGGIDMPIYGAVNATADLFDPAGNAFSPFAQNMEVARVWHTATRLNDGRVLIVGGRDGQTEQATAEIFDPMAGTFTYTAGPMAQGRAYHTATLLNDGRVLITGGTTPGGVTRTCEIFNPATGTFSAAPDMNEPRAFHTATLISGGTEVVVAGGNSGNYRYHASVETWTTGQPAWSLPTLMRRPRQWHGAALLPDGSVLLLGDLAGGATPSADILD